MQIMKTLAERLRAALAEAKINQSELSRRVGITRGAVSLWFNGATTSLEGENLLKAAQILGISANWLATGRGKMKSGPLREISLDGNPDYPVIQRVRINISPDSTGYSVESLSDESAPIVFARSWYDQNNYDPDALIAVRVPDAGMEPGLYETDWVVINTADTTRRNQVVFALSNEEGMVLKRLFRSDGHWIAASDNPDKRIYRDHPLDENALIIGRVVHKQSERI